MKKSKVCRSVSQEDSLVKIWKTRMEISSSKQITWSHRSVQKESWRKRLTKTVNHWIQWRSVQSLHVNVRMVFVQNVTVQTWQQGKPFRLVKQSVSLLLSPSVNLVHSWPCVHSIRVELPVTISHRVFLVSKSFLRQESRKDLRLSQSLPVRQQLAIQRKSVRSL